MKVKSKKIAHTNHCPLVVLISKIFKPKHCHRYCHFTSIILVALHVKTFNFWGDFLYQVYQVNTMNLYLPMLSISKVNM